MNIGKNIFELRKAKNVTQEALAAELGVTAAAVSKWENGYTLPDILMLCALADFFGVTTDELLGLDKQVLHAVIASQTAELGEAIRELAKKYGIVAKHIYCSYADAVAAVNSDASVTHLLASFDHPLSEEDRTEIRDDICEIESNAVNQQKVLDGFEIYLRDMPSFKEICTK